MEPEQKTNGALVGLIIIIVILAIGGIYMWKNSVPKNTTPTEDTTLDTTAETGTDDTAEIEANINNVDLDSLDSEI
ncbi:MAG: hypothetical protein AAB510_01135 [Patescibacteria group bacterium]